MGITEFLVEHITRLIPATGHVAEESLEDHSYVQWHG